MLKQTNMNEEKDVLDNLSLNMSYNLFHYYNKLLYFYSKD